MDLLRRSVDFVVLALALGCSSEPENDPAAGGSGGSGAGAAGLGGSPSAGQGGVAAGQGGTGAQPSQAGTSGVSGAAGTGGAHAGSGGGTAMFTCPAPPFAAMPVPQGATATRVTGLPPADAFNNNLNDFGIIEGPVWFDGSLYVSEIGSGSSPPPSRILKVTADGQISIAIPDAGTNGLGIDGSGKLLGCNHKSGALTRFDLSGAPPIDVASMFMNQRFNSPNDVAVRRDGNIYFTDPGHQAPSTRPQSATRAYRIAPNASAATPIVEGRPEPNGITLSADQNTLYVSGQDGVFSYPVMADGSVGAGTKLTQSIGGADGMGMDCAGNLYVTTNTDVIVLNASGAEVGRVTVDGVQSVTNVAFGGPERKTLYITSLGSGAQHGLFKIDLAIPGMPF